MDRRKKVESGASLAHLGNVSSSEVSQWVPLRSVIRSLQLGGGRCESGSDERGKQEMIRYCIIGLVPVCLIEAYPMNFVQFCTYSWIL
jgi:hypothetical protein